MCLRGGKKNQLLSSQPRASLRCTAATRRVDVHVHGAVSGRCGRRSAVWRVSSSGHAVLPPPMFLAGAEKTDNAASRIKFACTVDRRRRRRRRPFDFSVVSVQTLNTPSDDRPTACYTSRRKYFRRRNSRDVIDTVSTVEF